MRDDENEAAGAAGDGGEEAVARLLRLAGPRAPVPGERRERVREAVRREWRATRRRRLLLRRGAAWGLAAAALVLVGLGVARLREPAPAPVVVAALERSEGPVRVTGPGAESWWNSAGERLLSGSSVATGPTGRAALRMTGGGSLRLDHQTRVRFAAGEVVLEAGALYADIGEGERPLDVSTALGRVRDLGTQFEVRLAGEDLRVRVREGEVSIRGAAGAWQARAGEELVVLQRGGIARRAVPPHDDGWDWAMRIAPAFELDGRTLDEFLAWVQRESGREAVFSDAELARYAGGVVLHGTVTGLDAEEALAAVLPTCGLVHREVAGRFLISRSRSAAS